MQEQFTDVHILATWVHGPGRIHTADPVETPVDLEGMKNRGASRLVNKLLERMSANSVGMPVPAVSEALSKGVIHGTTIPWEVTPALKAPDLVEDHTEFEDTALYRLTFVLAMYKGAYNALPDDLKAVIDKNSGPEFSVFAGGTEADADGPARDVAVELGNNIITIDQAGTQEWRAIAQPIYEEWIADLKGKGIDGQKLIDDARSPFANVRGRLSCIVSSFSISRFMAILGGSVLFILVIMTCLSIVGRELNAVMHTEWFIESFGIGEIKGSCEISESGMAFVIFAFLPITQMTAGHAVVDILTNTMPKRVDNVLRVFSEVILALALILIATQLFGVMTSKMNSGQTTLHLEYPLWWGYAAGLTGAGRPGWREVTYDEARETVRALAAGLLARGKGQDTPLMILSGKEVDHGLLSLAAQYVGVPGVPLAEKYAMIPGAQT